MPINRPIINRTRSAGPEKSQLIGSNRQTCFLLKSSRNIWTVVFKIILWDGMTVFCFLKLPYPYLHNFNISLLLSLTSIQADISNLKIDPVLIKHCIDTANLKKTMWRPALRVSNFKHLISVVLENKISFASLRCYKINRQLIGGCLLLIVIARQLFF